MNSKEFNRVVFHSKEDMANSYNLLKAEKLLEKCTSKSKFTINDLFEFFNIQLYFENNIFLPKWTETDKKNFYIIIEEKWALLKSKLFNLNDENIEEFLQQLEYDYKSNFWDLTNKFNVHRNISKEKFGIVLKKFPYNIFHILPQNKIVTKFDKEIRAFLMDFEESAEILLSQFEEKNTSNDSIKYNFPKSLGFLDKETILIKYLDNPEANLNFIRLIERSIDSNQLRLSDKTRYLAKRRAKELNDEILEKGHSQKSGIQVGLSIDQEEPLKIKNEIGLYEVTYSKKWLDEIEDELTLFSMFKQLFRYTDETGLIPLVSKTSEQDVLERINMKSKNEYEIGQAFIRKEMLSIIQLHLFKVYLQRRNNNIENLINTFIQKLNDKIHPHKFIFQIRESKSSYVEKIRTIFPDFDFLLKQYKALADFGDIDLELLQSSSKPIGLSQIKSLAPKKYIYCNSDLILRLKHIFFSDQSHLFYTKKFGNKYRNLFDLLTKEKISLEDFSNYQKNAIQTLINDEYLEIAKGNIIEFKEITFIYVIRELYRNELLNYWFYPKFIRDEIDVMIEKELLSFKQTLFSEEEKKYFNFYLNKKEFTNGYDLRNKYLHGTNPISDEQHENDYYLILKVIVLTLLKIEDDINISKRTAACKDGSSLSNNYEEK